MGSNQKVYIISGSILLAALLVSVFIFYGALSDKTDKNPVFENDYEYELLAESNGMVLMADTGLDGEWLTNREDGKLQFFERYRVISKDDFENFTGNEQIINSLDITQDNAQAFLTYPDGTQENLALDRPYVRFSIFPPQDAGNYELYIKLFSGEEYNFTFNFSSPREVALTNTGKTMTQQKPEQEEGIILTPKEQKLLKDLQDTERESRTLQAFQLDDLDLRDAYKVFYIDPEGGIYGGRLEEVRDTVNIGEYYWLDIEAIETEASERENFIQAFEELEDPDPDVAYELERLKKYSSEFIFLAKVGGTWYYNISSYPF